jgi:hypothetical protein
VAHLSASSLPPRPACRRTLGMLMPRADQAGPTPPPRLHGRRRRATQSSPSSPVRSPCRHCGRSMSASAAAHCSVSPCVGLRRAPPKPVVYPTIAAPSSSRVHNAGESPSTPPCARVAAASLPPFPCRSLSLSLRSTLRLTGSSLCVYPVRASTV